MATTHKQDSRQVFGLTIRKKSHPDMRRLRRELGEARIHGTKFWESSRLLMDYLNTIGVDPGLRILEIGCGWGLAGIYCAKKFGAEVTALDADDRVFPYLEYHASLNKVEVATWHRRYEQVRKKDLEAFDLVIASDICFWPSLVDPLRQLVQRAARVNTRVIVTDPGRPTFTAVAEHCQERLGAALTPWVAGRPAMYGWVLDCDPGAAEGR